MRIRTPTMADYLVCLTTSGGVPLFSRSKGDLKQLPFPVIGSLNGVHMFANSHDLELLSTTTEDAKIVWKVYHSSLTLILIGSNEDNSDAHLTHLLDLVFHAMVLVYGQDDLINIKNVERFKREIKICFPLIDGLLGFSSRSSGFSEVTMAAETVMSSENAVLNSYLSAFSDAASSPYGAVMVHGRLSAATGKWWELAAVELVLLSHLIASLTVCASRDVAVFLPITSPTVPHRLLTFHLLHGIQVCILCGPTPSLSSLLTDIERFWKSAVDPLRNVTKLVPRNLPNSFQVDQNVLAFLVVNTHTHRCLCSLDPHPESRVRNKKTMPQDERKELLKDFYKYVVGNFWKIPVLDETTESKVSDINGKLLHECSDTYICYDTHKCYASSSNAHQIYMLFSNQMPNYAMRSLTQKTLDAVIKDKRATL